MYINKYKTPGKGNKYSSIDTLFRSFLRTMVLFVALTCILR